MQTLKTIKRPFYRIVDYLLSSLYFRQSLWGSCRDLFTQNHPAAISGLKLEDMPERYCPKIAEEKLHPAPLFITARFRSGSTFLWQVFRMMGGVTAYYEPLNARKWFLAGNEAGGTDPSHLGITSYHDEYQGMQDLDTLFKQEWSNRHLYMDASNADGKLFRYIEALVTRAKHIPVLQFNLVDFRLPWLKANFPNARIMHLYRHPREQWMSVQRDGAPVPLDYKLTEFSDLKLFYTLQVARDLRRVFPFLELQEVGHPYALHYLLWRLSYTFGKHYSDLSIAYEDLVVNFVPTMDKVVSTFNLPRCDLATISRVNQGKLSQRWKTYAPESWYAEIEQECDRVLLAFFSDKG